MKAYSHKEIEKILNTYGDMIYRMYQLFVDQTEEGTELAENIIDCMTKD